MAKCLYKSLFLVTLLLQTVAIHHQQQCDRTPETVLTPPSRQSGDHQKYQIEISGNPDSYVSEETYTVTLRLNPDHRASISSGTAASRTTFRDFILTVESSAIQDTTWGHHNPHKVVVPAAGSFQLLDDTLTKFSAKCPNTVIQTNSLPKREIQVLWRAPPTSSGCVELHGTVVETRFQWYTDDRLLTKRLCEEVADNENVQPAVLKHCCACDEAKYEVAFEGMWSRNTHPKLFPDNLFTTKFTDLIGASHRRHHAFWNYNHYASEGVRLLAEVGNTKNLEAELKTQSHNIRTIIKARELSYPNITGPTYTVFRVDHHNHLVSVMSKIVPSPDWIVGVANLELCLRNCSWVAYRMLNLFPWDVGTDDGYNYI